ncbi:NADH dehydrogenase [ubiquinone] 1 alpha subcomplex subunit 9, mitochondrial [Diprion similis]|uniref:NADH dehydrogenase [ubiquinone] 1 alpha subcomplex subunit 9, mitochondrial n=1 Tax=Diprion similis TaxID=362088 RepID=UPI001EF932BC|nr:NADH dehydrogenase [ubiquinone] 1 alpha subcomplex subunit 9, mitochondrial [Diprion similis]
MAALIPKSSFRIAKRQTVRSASVAVQICYYSDSPRVIKNDNPASFKRGTGGRSSFNGVVCTVFGCSGFLGRYVCNKLGKIGTQMVLPYRGDEYDIKRLKVTGDLGQVLFHPFDLRDEDSIRKCIKYSNVVINLIGREWETKNFKFDDVNVEGARRLARLAKEAGVERFIHLSALNASLNPEPILLSGGSRFHKSKAAGELAVKEEFPEATIIRPSVIYGQEDRFIKYYNHPLRSFLRGIPLWKKGEATEKQPVAVSDVAAGIVAAIRDPDSIGKTYQFVGPKRYQLSELLDWIFAVMRKDKSWGYSRYELRYDPFFMARIYANELLSPSYPFGNLHWEGVEIEHTSDKLKKGLPDLEDLGITPIEMEDQVPWEVRPYAAYQYYTPEAGEFPTPNPPKTIPIRFA